MSEHTPRDCVQSLVDLAGARSLFVAIPGRRGQWAVACARAAATGEALRRRPAMRHLIAAAPDLLGACNAALVAIDSIMPPEERGDVAETWGDDFQALESASDKLRAAIARAKGE